MRSLPDGQSLLALWERGQREHPVDRALSILEAFTFETRDALARLSIRRRDELLIASRVAAFGARLDGVAQCDACASELDVSVDLSARMCGDEQDGGTVFVAGREIGFRVPDSHDLAAIARCTEPRDAARALLGRCFAHDANTPLAPPDEEVAEAIGVAIERLCDASSIELAISCPECGKGFQLPVDIGEFLWDELSARARSLIEDVDTLASVYGWSEAAILALPEQRRRRYLELIR
ncbi:hypothetical protein AB4Y32_29535 [Paraburkholderia phymatum]|uniref:Uncharacterized protein n=1 Tax=Paraburkholderia phymatum TaxID=148447 RepID=A0ACC6U8J9_9BURK